MDVDSNWFFTITGVFVWLLFSPLFVYAAHAGHYEPVIGGTIALAIYVLFERLLVWIER